jgi:sterol desaturase/sphingolipid hydroxylase (fatty acid hydroxylase superfamily)
MLEIIKYITEHGVHPGWIIFTFIITITMFCQLSFLMFKYSLRHLNIRNKGWPPPHLDSDGDFKKEKCEDEDLEDK